MTTQPYALAPDAITTGPILVEGLLQALCQGVICAQAVRYSENTLDDTRRMMAFVGTLVTLSCLQTFVTVYKLWLVLVYHKHWSTSPLSWSDLFLNGLICTVCETFLVRRCWKVTEKNKWVLLGLGFIAGTTFIANVYLAIAIGLGAKHTVENNDPLKTNHYFNTVFSFNYWIVGSLVLDLTVTSILMVWLWKSKTGLGYLDKALKHIIGITWESAAIPFVSMVIAVSLYHTKPARDRHLVMFFILMTGKFYILGLFRTINSRGKLRERMKSNFDPARRSLSEWQWDQEPISVTVDSIPNSDDTAVSSAIPPTMAQYALPETQITPPPKSIMADQLSIRALSPHCSNV
ncbi:hypothetical protein BV25DRAFT_1817458 [Artomyces pyxidatus]|uniref:Uncharacterized protein n=1 Tax=Artomyces pyxidatus TaxID=48021 RepID=A0ACB8TJM0_9AGAM|nr:hypothetical protein BV25DRAFT_1817458 [Artomyces pyxidatus]